MGEETASRRGAQTLARGIRILQAAASADDGIAVQEAADLVGVHRTIAYRVLQTLADAGLLARGADGRYRGSVGLLALADRGLAAFRAVAVPILRRLADRLSATVSLLVEEGDSATALAVIEPRNADYHLSFAEGSRHALDRGSAGLALTSLRPASDDDPEELVRARELGWARTFGEVEPGAHGLAVPVPAGATRPACCINLITYSEQTLDGALELMLEAAADLASRID